MKKFIAIAAAAMVSLASVAPAVAWELDWKAGAGASLGATGNLSGTKNFSEGTQNGLNAKSFSKGEGYGLSESTFEGNYQGSNGGPVSTSFKGTTTLGSGSLSNVSTEVKGNGNASAANNGFGYGAGASIGGAGAISTRK